MKQFCASLLASTAICAVAALPSAIVSSAVAAPLTISAPSPGQTLTPGSDLDVSLLTVGDKAGETGTLVIENGISVDASTGVVIGNETGSTGTMTVSGSDADLSVVGYLKVGGYGAGSLSFSGGATGSTTSYVYVGQYDDNQNPTISGQGTLSIDGVGTNVVLESIEVNTLGGNTSTVSVTGGAHLTTRLNFYGRGDSHIYINGAGTVLKVGARDDDEVTYGNADGWFSPDAGDIELSGGAVLDADGSYIGGAGTASMLVTGAGTRWVNSLPLFIGGTGNGTTGTGTVTVADGAYVRGATVAVGVDAGSTGTLTVKGAGTILEVVQNVSAGSPGNFRAGSAGNGTVTVSDGALIKARNQISIASFAGSTGVLNIGAAEGSAAAAAGHLDGGLLGVVLGEGDATLVFNHTETNYDFDQVLSGTGTIKLLAGTTRFTTDAGQLTAQTQLSGGKAYIDANLSGLNVTASGGGELNGTGTIGALSVEAGGVVRPGNDGVGTLTATGDVYFQSGSKLAIDVSSAGADQLALTGTSRDFTVANGALLDLNLTPGVDPTQTYVIVDTNGGEVFKNGTGFITNDHASLVDSLVSYNPDSVELYFVAAEVDWADFGETDNQKAAAAALQALGPANALFKQAMFLSDEQMTEGFDLLSGEVHGTAGATLLTGSRWLRDASLGRFDNLGAAEASDGDVVMGYAATATAEPSPFDALTPDSAATTGWFTGFGSIAESDGDGNGAASTTRTAGVLTGADTEIDGWRVGLAAGFGHDALDAGDRASTAAIDTLYAGTYAGTAFEGWRIKLGAGLGYSHVETERETPLPGSETLSAEYGALSAQAFGELGYALDLGGGTVEPFGQLALVGVSRDAYTETGGIAALSADAETSGVGFTTIGLRTSTAFGATTLKGSVAWQHAYGDVDAGVTQNFNGGGAFTVTGTPIAEDTLSLGLGLEQAISTEAALGIAYDGEFAEDTTRHSVTGRVQVKF